MKIVQIPNGQFVENCYLVTDEASRECVVIDPGEEAGLILRRITEAGVRTVAIWVTHAHLDHVMGVPRLSRETGAPIYLHPADRELYDHVIQQGLAFGIRVESLPPPDREFVPGETVRVGTVGFTVRHAPGHSPGSVCLVGDGVVFTGDVLFAGSIGRTDLTLGDPAAMSASLVRFIETLPPDTVVYPGHGPRTTLTREKQSNPFLLALEREPR